MGGEVKDLVAERARALGWDQASMTDLIYGGRDNVLLRRKFDRIVATDPVFSRKRDKHFLSRVQTYEWGLQIANRFAELFEDNKLSAQEAAFLWSSIDEQHQLSLHHVMFIPCIEGQGTEEQQKKWIPLARTYQIIGTYAQTELGHGSYIRGLETTAEFDPKTDEIILNSPSLTSLKWWPGSLGKTATHAVVLAQLHSSGKYLGLQAFIVQLRSLETHLPLEGVEVGDIGPKLGFSMVDNGFLKLTNVRIPRENMLMRYAKLERDGSFSRPSHSKLGYGTMVFVRAQIVNSAASYIARAATIAVRYSVVRRQFLSDDDEKIIAKSGAAVDQSREIQIIDYYTQQQKLFPLIALSYAASFMGKDMLRLYNLNNKLLEKGDVSLLPEVHALSSGLKALMTELSVEGMEVCRKSLGGHGYSRFSGIVELYEAFLPSQTYEGENTVLYLQVARFLIKALQKAQKIPTGSKVNLPKSIAYFAPGNLSNHNILRAFQLRVLFLVQECGKFIFKQISSGSKFADAWNAISVDLVRAAKAHSQTILVETFLNSLGKVDASLQRVLALLWEVLAGTLIENNSGEFLESKALSVESLREIRLRNRKLLSEIRPHAVKLMDAWEFSDFTLNSSLGRYDGRVYEDMLAWAKQGPLNKSDVAPGVLEVLKPMMKREKPHIAETTSKLGSRL